MGHRQADRAAGRAGIDDFVTVVREHLDDDSTQNLMTLLDQAEQDDG